MKYRSSILLAALSAAGLALAPASASAAEALGTTSCSLTDLSVTATSCAGFFEGNLVSGNSSALADSANIIDGLLGASYTGATLPITETLPSLSGSKIDFAAPLYGRTVIAVHVGAANGQADGVGYQGTAFYAFDAGALANGLDTLNFGRPGLSNARLFSTSTSAVPEPASWALLLVGFGLIGVMVRRGKAPQQRRPASRLSIARLKS